MQELAVIASLVSTRWIHTKTPAISLLRQAYMAPWLPFRFRCILLLNILFTPGLSDLFWHFVAVECVENGN